MRSDCSKLIIQSVTNYTVCGTRIHKDSPIIPILNRINPEIYFLKIRSDIVTPMTLCRFTYEIRKNSYFLQLWLHDLAPKRKKLTNQRIMR